MLCSTGDDFHQPLFIVLTLSDAGARMFRENEVNSIDADALAPCVSRSSAAMILTVQDKQVLVLYNEELHSYW